MGKDDKTGDFYSRREVGSVILSEPEYRVLIEGKTYRRAEYFR